MWGIVSVKKILNVECGFALSDPRRYRKLGYDKNFEGLLDGELSGPLRINLYQVLCSMLNWENCVDTFAHEIEMLL